MIKGRDYIAVSAITLCHDGQGNYLLGQRSEQCCDEQLRWDIIGSGKVEFGERLEETVKREVKEETGADVKKIEHLGFREVRREDERGLSHWIAFDFKVEIDRDQVYNPEPEKCLGLQWCKLEDFPEPMHSQWPIFFEKYKDKL